MNLFLDFRMTSCFSFSTSSALDLTSKKHLCRDDFLMFVGVSRSQSFIQSFVQLLGNKVLVPLASSFSATTDIRAPRKTATNSSSCSINQHRSGSSEANDRYQVFLAMSVRKKRTGRFIAGRPTSFWLFPFSETYAKSGNLIDSVNQSTSAAQQRRTWSPSSLTRRDLPVPLDCTTEMQRPKCFWRSYILL